MLRHLHVRNLAVIEEANVEFADGLNVVTGSTGAGKSLVVDSLALLAGSRASADLLRTGADKLTVTGVFQPSGEQWRRQLADAGIECEDEELVVRREVGANGRGRVFLNDQPSTLRLLGEISGALLRIHGQREELGLTTPDLQRQWLDLEGGDAGARLLKRCEAAWAELLERADRLEILTGDDRARQQRLDLLRYQLSEIEQAQLVEGEEESLRAERETLRHADTIRESLTSAVAELSESDDAAAARLSRARTALRTLAEVQPEASEWVDEIEELRIRVEDLGATLAARLDAVSADPRRLDAVESRLALLERLFRKYAPTSREVLEMAQTFRREIDELRDDDERLAELRAEVEQARAAFGTSAAELSGRRQQWATRLARKVERQLAELALGKARFEIDVSPEVANDGGDHDPLTVRVGGSWMRGHAFGIDRVTYRFAGNPGEEARPLARVASGGELARIYLALQVAALGRSQREEISLVFDEVDVGIGGREASVVGRKLRDLAVGGQILAVTHLPQVAAFGHRHLLVSKQQGSRRTGTQVLALDRDHRVEEMSRMLGGEEITDLTRSHALQLLEEARVDGAEV